MALLRDVAADENVASEEIQSATEQFLVARDRYERAIAEAEAEGVHVPRSIGIDTEIDERVAEILKLGGEMMALYGWALAEQEPPPEGMIVEKDDDGAVMGYGWEIQGRDREVKEQVEAEMRAEAFARRPLPAQPIRASTRQARPRSRQARVTRRARAPTRLSGDDPPEPDLDVTPLAAFRAEVDRLLGGRPC